MPTEPDQIPAPSLDRAADALAAGYREAAAVGLPCELEPFLAAAAAPLRPALRLRLAGPTPGLNGRIRLLVVEGPNTGGVYEFVEHDTFLVGRSPEAHFSIPGDRFFSRMHFMLEVNPPRCRLLDLQSRNKTYVNDQPVTEAELADGDRIRAGRTVFAVTVERPPAPPPSPPPPSPPPARESADRTQPHVPAAAAAPVLEVTRPHPPGQLLVNPSAAIPPPDPPGLPAIPGHRFVRVLGKGGMGVVYLAEPEAGGRPVAVKTIKPANAASDTAVSRFLREAEILKQLRHPHVVSFHALGRAGELLYFVMDYVPGTDAGCLLRKHGPLPVARAVTLVRHLLKGLGYAHAAGFVHRDVKPSNLLVTTVKRREVGKVADFGLARAYHSSTLSGITLTGITAGTPAFMSPEQVTDFRRVAPAGDQFSAAATLYTLLTGRSVHGPGDDPVAMYQRILLNRPTPLREVRPDVPAGLEAAVHRALAHKPAQRFADVETFRRALKPFAR